MILLVFATIFFAVECCDADVLLNESMVTKKVPFRYDPSRKQTYFGKNLDLLPNKADHPSHPEHKANNVVVFSLDLQGTVDIVEPLESQRASELTNKLETILSQESCMFIHGEFTGIPEGKQQEALRAAYKVISDHANDKKKLIHELIHSIITRTAGMSPVEKQWLKDQINYLPEIGTKTLEGPLQE